MVIPGVGTPGPGDWHDNTGKSWLRAIPTTAAPGLAVLAFQHDVKALKNFSWQALLSQGEVFLTSLLQLIEDEKVILPNGQDLLHRIF